MFEGSTYLEEDYTSSVVGETKGLKKVLSLNSSLFCCSSTTILLSIGYGVVDSASEDLVFGVLDYIPLGLTLLVSSTLQLATIVLPLALRGNPGDGSFGGTTELSEDVIHMEDDVDISVLTMEQYIALIPDDIKPGIVNPKIGDDVEFEINSNFMRELRCKLFAGTDDEDAYKHVRTVL
ncbi:hypothetical protein Tco_0961735 [Tanacetum coccineum]